MSKLAKQFLIFTSTFVFFVQFFVAIPAIARDFNATTFPILGQSAEQLGVIIAKGTREKDGKRLIMTAHLSFPVERKRALVIKVEENSANTKITGEKDLVSGESKIFLNVEETLSGAPYTPPIMLMFDGEISTEVPLIEISRHESTVSGTWSRVCSNAGCFPVPIAGYNQQHYVWRSELQITALRAFVNREGKPNDRLVFWVGTWLNDAPKQARKTSDGNYLLFRNQAKAVLDALEIAPR